MCHCHTFLRLHVKINVCNPNLGLGECQLSLAKSLMEDCRDGGAIDLIEKAIQNLFR